MQIKNFWERWQAAGEDVHGIEPDGSRYCLMFRGNLFRIKTNQLYESANGYRETLETNIDAGKVRFVRHINGQDIPLVKQKKTSVYAKDENHTCKNVA